MTVRLTEVEAYQGQGEDPGSHAFRGPTGRNAAMFGEAAHLYAYFTYGMHTCANITVLGPGRGAAVLLRAGEVVDGLDLARSRRPTSRRDIDLARGPARLCVALGITLDEDGADLLAPPYGLELTAVRRASIMTGPRVGVSGPGGDAEQYPWRFRLADEPTVSRYRPAAQRPRAR